MTLGDSLAVIKFHNSLWDEGQQPFTFSVWILKEYKCHESWTNVYSFTRREIFPRYILGMRRNGDVILQRDEEKRQVCRYNPLTSTNVWMGAEMENNVFFRYYKDSLYLLEKKELVGSY